MNDIKNVSADEIKKMSVMEFRELGYLQELNRRFLHPLGLALEVEVHPDGTESFGEVWDGREDPEGWVFGEGIELDAEAARRIATEWVGKQHARITNLGWDIQPVN